MWSRQNLNLGKRSKSPLRITRTACRYRLIYYAYITEPIPYAPVGVVSSPSTL